MTIALIDADVVMWRAACSAEKEEAWVACARADQMMQDIIADTKADSYRAFISGARHTNFRVEINPLYKANRADLPQPAHKSAVREFLVTQWKAEITEGAEADDFLGMNQRENTIICGVDKDLLQIPGKHYNFVKKVFTEVTYDQGIKALYMQSLVGDRADNIFGVQGIGPVKAQKLLGELYLEEELYEACRGLYNDDERFHTNMKLLYIWRKPNDQWKPPLTTATDDPDGSAATTAKQNSSDEVMPAMGRTSDQSKQSGEKQHET